MYNGIGLTTVRGSGTSGYVQSNKFNLSNQRPRQQTTRNDLALEGPKQTKANDAILEHNRKREVEKKLMELEDDLTEAGFSAEEIVERLDAKRQELLAQAEAQPTNERTAAETHALAKKKAAEMDKIRAAFGLSADVKEGQAFDQELQEQLKQERIAAREAQQLQKEKNERKQRKAKKKEEKARKKAEKKKAKEAKKQAVAKAKEVEKKRILRDQQEAERQRVAAENKEKRRRDLQARLGSKHEAPDRSDQEPERKRRRHSISPEPRETEERYVPQEEEPDNLIGSPVADRTRAVIADSPVPETRRPQGSGVPSEQPSSIGHGAGHRRSATPSPSPMLAALRKQAPPPRPLSPERSGPQHSPPHRNRQTSTSLSPAPNQHQGSGSRHQNGGHQLRVPSLRRRRSPSPRRRRSPSPRRRRSPSPRRRRSPSPRRRRSPSPRHRRHLSPSRRNGDYREPDRRPLSPRHMHRRAPSPSRRRSPSPLRAKAPSPSRRRSPPMSRRRSPSPPHKRASASSNSASSNSSTSNSSRSDTSASNSSGSNSSSSNSSSANSSSSSD